MRPKRLITSIPYCEQVGLNRQDIGIKGEIIAWYSLIKNIVIWPLIFIFYIYNFSLKNLSMKGYL